MPLVLAVITLHYFALQSFGITHCTTIIWHNSMH
uniref:Uncharacterized protein n=1 Tax=Anguilla anguilla TaxID=7936 RepID=A0A0E9U418_ANGAN